MAEDGLHARWVSVRASDVGAAHRRERLFIVAHPADADLPRLEGREPALGHDMPAGGYRGALSLLKTPTTQLGVNGGSQHPDKRRAGGHGPTLADQVEHLLPTPKASDGPNGGPGMQAYAGTWGDPTEPTGKGGRARLSRLFTEWHMGLPDGHVTAVEGLSYPDTLRVLGNGVLPAQAAYALRWLLSRDLIGDVAETLR